MISSITTAAQSTASTQQMRTSNKPPQPKAQSDTTRADTVQLSSAAQARLAAMTETMETPAQTIREAAGGDRQAQRLFARENAAKGAKG
jgi:hypothetical protein